MKSPKRIAALLFAGFIAFAPPGTLIFLLILAVGFVGRRWVAVVAAFCIIVCTTLLFLRRRRLRENSSEH